MREIDYELLLETEDSPSSKDWKYSDYMEQLVKNKDEEMASGVRPSIYWDKAKMIVWDQFDQRTTYKGCTAYGLTSPYNGYNLREWASVGQKYEQENPRRKWEAYQATRGRPNKGSTLQKLMSFFRSRKLIDGNVVAEGKEEMINALDNGFYIYTGTNSCNWKVSGKAGVFTYKKNGGGHAFSIVDYTDKGFVAINSFGEDRGDKGYFIIPFKDIKHLYSANVIIDHDNTGSLQSLRDDADIQKAISMGITNGSNLEDFATRKQTVLMIVRGLAIKE